MNRGQLEINECGTPIGLHQDVLFLMQVVVTHPMFVEGQDKTVQQVEEIPGQDSCSMERLPADVLAQKDRCRTPALGQGRPRCGILNPWNPRQPLQGPKRAPLPGQQVPRQERAPRHARARGQPSDYPLLSPAQEFHTPQEIAL